MANRSVEGAGARTEYRVGIDVGGTFVDLVLAIDGTVVRSHKELSASEDRSESVLRGLEALAQEAGESLASFLAAVPVISHGTTATTNAVLTGTGARTALFTTKGFRDALEMRRGIKEEVWDLKYQAPAPLVPRHWRLPISERLDERGNVLVPLDANTVRDGVDRLKADGVEAIAICFLHSYVNPTHERAASAIVADEWADAHVSLSADVLPQVRFYDRTSTTVLNAYLGPLLSGYLSRLSRRLADAGFAGTLLIVNSAGGVMSPAVASLLAASTIASGPAAGPVAAARFAAVQGYGDCTVVDMGGTSFDASIVRDGRPDIVSSGTIDRRAIALPMVGVHSVGAGGGSIAWLDAGDLLRVGPRSAGARPGPACYGAGGAEPTVTDADLLLGFLDPDFFLGGRMRLDRAKAEESMREHLGALGPDPLLAAAGIWDVVNANMAAGLRRVTLERGLDARNLPMVVAGGAGPVHAAAIALEMDVSTILVPRSSSTFCALGTLLLDYRHEYVRSCVGPLFSFAAATIQELYGDMSSAGRRTLCSEGVLDERIRISYAADLRYERQFRELTIAVPDAAASTGDLSGLAARFHDAHEEVHGYATPELPIELVNLRITALGLVAQPRLPDVGSRNGVVTDALKGYRNVYQTTAANLAPMAVYDGEMLRFGDRIEAPAIIELANTTVVVQPPFSMVVDRLGTFTLFQPRVEDEVLARISG